MNRADRTGHAMESGPDSGKLLNGGASDVSQGNAPQSQKGGNGTVLVGIRELLQATLQNTLQHLATDVCQRLFSTHCPGLSLQMPGFPSAVLSG